MAEWRDLPDEDRDMLIAEHDLVCPSCGNLRSECSDPAVDWHPRTTVCFASATTQWANRRLSKKHEKTKPTDDALGPLDGVGVWVSTMPPPEGQDEFA